MKYQLKRRMVDAVQFQGTAQHAQEVRLTSSYVGNGGDVYGSFLCRGAVNVVKKGWWILTDEEGDRWCITDKTFKDAWEPVT